VLLFNTCSVREHAEEKTFSALGRVRLLKRDKPGTVVGVLGCMAQKDQELIRKRAPYVDMIVGTGQLAAVPELVAKVRATREPQLAVSLGRADAGRHEVRAGLRHARRSGHRRSPRDRGSLRKFGFRSKVSFARGTWHRPLPVHRRRQLR